jgi:hypothetical protein
MKIIILNTIDFGLSGKELANSLPDKQLQSEFPDNLKLSGNKHRPPSMAGASQVVFTAHNRSVCASGLKALGVPAG